MCYLQDCEAVEVHFISAPARKSDAKQQSDLLQERFGSSMAILLVLLLSHMLLACELMTSVTFATVCLVHTAFINVVLEL